MTPTVQALLVAAIVLACAWRAFARLAPKAAWRAQARVAYTFEMRGRVAWLRVVGRWLRPRDVVAGSGCGSGGCNTCGACETPAPVAQARGIPLRLV